MNDGYHEAITVMPNGQVYAGDHGETVGYPDAPLIASLKKERKTGLHAKTMLSKNLTSLSASIVETGARSLSQLTAATTIANQTNLAHLELVRLYPELQGKPMEYFFLDNLFIPRDVPQLQLRETFYDTTATAQYKGRLEETNKTKTNYDEIKYLLLKLSDKVYTPIEDIMMTIINPETVDLEQIRFGFKWKRNQSAAAALATIGNTQSSLDSPLTLASGGFHSTYHVATELNSLFLTFLKTNDVPITDVAMNPTDFMNYAENTWTVSGPAHIEPIRLAAGGVVPLPGIPGVTATVDLAVPAGTIYAINKPNALRLGEGPKVMRRYYDEERDAEAIKFLDFHQYLATGSQLSNITRKFGMTIPIPTT